MAPPLRQLVEYGSELLARLAAVCEADPARESCGLVVRCGGRLEPVQVANVVDRFNEADPDGFPRTGYDGFVMDPRTLLTIFEELERTGGELVAVWHSHVDAGAELSALDRADAVFDGRQVLPGAEYLVFGMSSGRVFETRRYVFRDGEFVEAALA
jgi:proteasome lid subunit RPN8/RPN11